jgi:hypothetical protein
MMIHADHEFVDCLLALANKLKSGAKADKTFTDTMARSFLKHASETPDNLSCVEHLEYGSVANEDTRRPEEVYGLKVRGKDVRLSDIFWQLESEAGVQLIRESFPDLSVAEAEAALRMCTFILLNFEATVRGEAKS